MNLELNFFSEGDENFDFWEFAKKKKKNKEGKGTGFLLYPLRPFRPFLIKALQKNGVPLKVEGKGLKRKVKLNNKRVEFGPLVYLFGKHVMKGQPYNASAANNYMEAYDFYEYENAQTDGSKAGAAAGGVLGGIASAVPGGGLALGLTSGLVKAIIDFIKGLRDKKRRGEKLSPKEEQLADLYDKTEKEIQQEARDIAEEKVGEKLLNPTTLLLIGAAAVAVIFIARKK